MHRLIAVALMVAAGAPSAWAGQVTADDVAKLLVSGEYAQLQQSIDAQDIDQRKHLAMNISAVEDKLESRKDLRALLDGWVERYPSSTFAWAARGFYFLDVGFDARGVGFADAVTPEAYAIMRESAKLAEADLERSYALDPGLHMAAVGLMQVAMALGRDRAYLERQFERAIAAKPDSRSAHEQKWLYLLDRWYGAEGEALAFAREVYEAAPPGTKLRTLLATAHFQNYTGKQFKLYLQRPEVWAEIQGPMEEYLTANPDDLFYRNKYAHMAYYAGRNVIAVRELKVIGQNWDAGVWESRERFEEAQRYLFGWD